MTVWKVMRTFAFCINLTFNANNKQRQVNNSTPKRNNNKYVINFLLVRRRTVKEARKRKDNKLISNLKLLL